MNTDHPFTYPRDRIVVLLANGRSPKEVCDTFSIGEQVLRNYLNDVYCVIEERTGTRPKNRVQIINALIENNLLFLRETPKKGV